jgi:protein-tyrosine phosphatase
MKECRRLLIDKMSNTRELGGFCTNNGLITKHHVFLRSEAPLGLTLSDVCKLKEYNIKNCIDLHGNPEGNNYSHPFILDKELKYFNHPILSTIIRHDGSESDNFDAAFWVDVYIDFLENSKSWINAVLTTCSSTIGGTLIHCRTGKSRTAIICMLLMLIAEVPYTDIIAEFATTDIYMHDKYNEMLKTSFRTVGFYSSPAFIMRDTINYLNSRYGDVCKYLDSCDISHNVIDGIKLKFLDSI